MSNTDSCCQGLPVKPELKILHRPCLSLSFYLSSFFPRYIVSPPSPSPSVTFVTAIVTWGCLSPTMHCNPSVSQARGGTAVTSTEREEGEVEEKEKNLQMEEKEEKGGAEVEDDSLHYLN